MNQCTWCGKDDAITNVLKDGYILWFCCGIIEVTNLTTDEIFPDLKEKDMYTRSKEIRHLKQKI